LVAVRREARFGGFTSASPRRLDGGDADLLHRHHRLEGALCLTAAGGKRTDLRRLFDFVLATRSSAILP